MNAVRRFRVVGGGGNDTVPVEQEKAGGFTLEGAAQAR